MLDDHRDSWSIFSCSSFATIGVFCVKCTQILP